MCSHALGTYLHVHGAPQNSRHGITTRSQRERCDRPHPRWRDRRRLQIDRHGPCVTSARRRETKTPRRRVLLTRVETLPERPQSGSRDERGVRRPLTQGPLAGIHTRPKLPELYCESVRFGATREHVHA